MCALDLERDNKLTETAALEGLTHTKVSVCGAHPLNHTTSTWTMVRESYVAWAVHKVEVSVHTMDGRARSKCAETSNLLLARESNKHYVTEVAP